MRRSYLLLDSRLRGMTAGMIAAGGYT